MTHIPVRVLLIDDDEDDYIITRELLEEIETQRYELDWASTYEVGLAQVKQQQHDVYLIDYRLGVRTGLELLQEAIAAGCTAPLILLTGQGDHDIDLRAAQAGAADYLLKGKLSAQLLERSMRYAIEQKRTQKALRESELRYRNVSELLADLAFAYRVTSDNYLVREWITGTFSDITGYMPAELEKDGYWFGQRIVHPDDREILQNQIKCFFAGDEDISEYRIITKEGEVRWLRLYMYPEWSHEMQRATYLYGAAQDVTAEKQAAASRAQLEEQLRQSQKMEAIGQLAGGIAHDFNNSLAIITTCTELLLYRYLEDPTRSRQYVEEIKEAGDRAASLIRQLLAFSRKQVLRPHMIDLNRLVVNLDKMLRRLIGANIMFQMQLAEGLARIKADPTQLEQVIMNLIINARDAMPKGGTLIVETKAIDLHEQCIPPRQPLPEGRYVVLSVSDTGMGMDQATMARIFEPFFTTKASEKGTGLGLATVYGIVQQSEGQIEVWSDVGLGTTFKIYFPTKRVDSTEATLLPQFTTSRETILVVLEDVVVREQIGQLLRERDFLVLEAGSDDEALHISRVHQGRIDLLLAETASLWRAAGQQSQLTDALSALNPDIKVLCITGYTRLLLDLQGVVAAETAVLERPFNVAQLYDKVVTLLDMR